MPPLLGWNPCPRSPATRSRTWRTSPGSTSTDAELDHLAPQLSVILESVASISGVAGADVPPTSHALPLTNVFREDVVTPCLTPEQALSGAPEVDQQRFSVPRILGDEQ